MSFIQAKSCITGGQALVFVLTLLWSHAAVARTWTSAGGGFSVEADFVRLEGGNVVLRRVSDSQELRVPVDKLSDSDQAFIQQQNARPSEDSGKPAEVSPNRLPVPDEKAVEKANGVIAEIYPGDAKPATMLKDARATKSDPTGRYALLLLARNRAADQRDVETALAAVDDLANWYAVDRLTLRGEVVVRLGRAATLPSQYEKVAELALALIDDAIKTDQFDAAAKLCTLADAAARRSQKVDRIKQVVKRTEQVKSLQTRFAEVEQAVGRLKNNADDAEAKLTVGHYRALVQGRWEEGLPLLAQGSDAKLKQLAELDLKNPTASDQQVELADAWLDLAEATEEGITKSNLQDRARYWYQRALPQLAGLVRRKVEVRLKELPGAEEETPRVGSRARGTQRIPKQAAEYRGHSYYVYTNPSTWEEAHRQCERLGGYLCRIESAEEQAFVSRLVAPLASTVKFMWVDGSDEKREGYWVFRNGKEIPSLKAWAIDQPDNGGNGGTNESFLSLTLDAGGRWNDMPGSTRLFFLCEWEEEGSRFEREEVSNVVDRRPDDGTLVPLSAQPVVSIQDVVHIQVPDQLWTKASLGRVETEDGINMHPWEHKPALVAFRLNRKFQTLRGKAGLNGHMGNTESSMPIIFTIYGDKRVLWKSKPLQKRGEFEEFNVEVEKVKVLTLSTQTGARNQWAHAVFADVVLVEK